MTEKNGGPLSDPDGGERPVREQLQKATINQNPTAPVSDSTAAELRYCDDVNARGQDRGRLQKKRSFDEVEIRSQDEGAEIVKPHTRKRSRDSTNEEDVLNSGQRKLSGDQARDGSGAAGEITEDVNANGSATAPQSGTPEPSEKQSDFEVEALTSPKTKRSRIHSAAAEVENASAAPSAVNEADIGLIDEEASSASKPTNGNSARTSVPPTSGFANSSAASPFGALANNKSPTGEKQTSDSAFASSGFSALTSSSSSGFGAVGKDSGGFGTGSSFATGFKSPAPSKQNENSTFGGALGQQSAFASTAPSASGFGMSASGFGKLGSGENRGFGSGLQGSGLGSIGGGLSSFASGKSVTALGQSTKPFGAPADDDDENDEEDDKAGMKSPLATEGEKQDERFYEQELETGEEDEETEFYARAKLYSFTGDKNGKREWRERGLGTVRFNVKKPSTESEKPKARLLMRAEGSHRVMLNTPVKKEIRFGTPNGEKPNGGIIFFTGTIEGREGLELLQLKLKQVDALDLYDQIVSLQVEM